VPEIEEGRGRRRRFRAGHQSDRPAERAREAIANAFHGISTVYHLAAAYREELGDRTEFQRTNVEATRNLLDAASAQGVRRFVHCSTVGVQGQIDEPPATEDYRLAPGDHYQQSKLDGEVLALDYAKRGLPLVVVRPVGIYGPGDLRFLKLFRSIERGRFVMIGSGRSLYHLTYIEDVVQGFVLAGASPTALGEIFTIAGPRYTTLKVLVGMVADALGKPHPWLRVPFAPVYAASVVSERICRVLNVSPFLYPRRVEFFSKDRAFDTTKARRMLGYQPAVDLETGLRKTAQWYREARLL
jgi:nucleoside-diphosphate-sugar epimerase